MHLFYLSNFATVIRKQIMIYGSDRYSVIFL